MSEETPNPDTQDTGSLPPTSTHRYGASPYAGYGGGAYGEPPAGYGFGVPSPSSAPDQPRRSRGRGTLTAAVLAGALVLGGLGGVAGAAGFALVDSGSAQTSTTAPAQASSTSVSDHNSVAAPDGSVEQVANSVLPSVVKINVRGAQEAGSGSGIILSSDGEILTNNHVVAVAAGGGSISVDFNDGSAAKAHVVGVDPLTDLAVIKAEGVSGLTPATLDKSGTPAVGEGVVAIGSPFGLQATVTSGIVSALNRPVSVGDPSTGSTTDTTYPAIQTDAAINPGNSGGPLVNMNGEVIGINSSIRTASDTGAEAGSIGLGFAIPIEKVLPIVEQLRHGQTPTHAKLGVSVTDATSDNDLLTGAGITSVGAGSAAQQAGLERGDVVTKVDNEAISGAESLVATIRGHRPGDKVTLTVVRHGKTRTVDVTLDSDKGSPAS
jgi:putative serine protease PepD